MAGSIWIWRAVRVLSNSEGIFDHFYRKTDTQSSFAWKNLFINLYLSDL